MRFILPYGYSIDNARRLVISTGSDCLTSEEIQAHQDKLLNDPEFNPGFNQLIDVRGVTVVTLSAAEVRRLARRIMFSRLSRRAWVATLPAVFGVGRMLWAYHETGEAPSEVCAFYDLLPALKWLGLDEGSFSRMA
jgi:hypothetical protein